MKRQGLKTISLDDITCKHIGKRGTGKREAFENELRLDLLGETTNNTNFFNYKEI